MRDQALKPKRPRVGDIVQYFTREPDEQLWGSDGGPYAAIVTKRREETLVALAIVPPFSARVRAIGWVRHQSEAGDATRWWAWPDAMSLFAPSHEGGKSDIRNANAITNPRSVSGARDHAPRSRTASAGRYQESAAARLQRQKPSPAAA